MSKHLSNPPPAPSRPQTRPALRQIQELGFVIVTNPHNEVKIKKTNFNRQNDLKSKFRLIKAKGPHPKSKSPWYY